MKSTCYSTRDLHRLVSVLVVLPVAILFGTEAAAQGDPCRGIIPDGGAYRSIDLTEKNELDILDYTLVKQSSSRAASLDASGNAKFPVEGIPVDFGSTFKGAKSKFEAVERSQYFELHKKDFFEYRLLEGDPTIVNAWSTCIKNTRGLELSFHALDATELRYKLSVKWSPSRDNEDVLARLTRPIKLTGFGRVLSNGCERPTSKGFFAGIAYWAGRARKPDAIGPGGCDIEFERRSTNDTVSAAVYTEPQNVTISLPATQNFAFEKRPYRVMPGINPANLIKADRLPPHGEVTANRERVGYAASFEPWRVEMPAELIAQGWVFERGTEKITAKKSTIAKGNCLNKVIDVASDVVIVTNGANVLRGDTPIPCEFTLDVGVVRLAPVPAPTAADLDPKAQFETAAAPSIVPPIIMVVLVLITLGAIVWFWRFRSPSTRRRSRRIS